MSAPRTRRRGTSAAFQATGTSPRSTPAWRFTAWARQGSGSTAQLLLALAALTVSPVRFLYPNLAPRPWKLPVMLGAAAWLAVLLGMLLVYRRVPAWVVAVSLIYPAFYATLSI